MHAGLYFFQRLSVLVLSYPIKNDIEGGTIQMSTNILVVNEDQYL